MWRRCGDAVAIPTTTHGQTDGHVTILHAQATLLQPTRRNPHATTARNGQKAASSADAAQAEASQHPAQLNHGKPWEQGLQ